MESGLFSLAGKLLGELSVYALKETVKLWGLGSKKEFEKLGNTLTTIKSVLLDVEQMQAEEMQTTNHLVNDWLKKLKVVLYEVEDVLAIFNADVYWSEVKNNRKKRAKKVRILFSRSMKIGFRFKMGKKVKAVRAKLDAMAKDVSEFNIVKRVPRVRKREETHSYPPPLVVGREKDVESVVQLLRNSDVEADLSLVSIRGIGGLGKTTLAQLVHKFEKHPGEGHPKHFELVMWVYVSNLFDIKQICQSIIRSATGKECKSTEMDGVANELKESINNKRFLLVLDDMWEEEPAKWLELKNLLLSLGGAKGSKILITTWSELVSDTAISSSVYVLNGLSTQDSRSLFKHVAFGPGQEPDSDTKRDTGNKIADKCYGVALAVTTIASTLGWKKDDDDWLFFKKHKLPKMTQTDENGIMPALKFSYNYMPPELKLCFAYCAVFPKGHEFLKDTLIQMWMAQGFLSVAEGRETPEEVGKQYFKGLVRRSFFQESGIDENGNKTYKMHDLILGLARHLQDDEVYTMDSHGDVVSTTRHAWVTSLRSKQAKNLRTCVFEKDSYYFGITGFETIIGRLKLVRVLDLRWTIDRHLPKSISRLTHLSYLDLSKGQFDRLSESICKLHSLQTLKLNGCRSLQVLPKRTKDLVNLRHLYIENCPRLQHMPRGLGELTCLQTLPLYVIGPTGGSFAEQMIELKNLASHCSSKNLRIECKRGMAISKMPKAPLATIMTSVEDLSISIISVENDSDSFLYLSQRRSLMYYDPRKQKSDYDLLLETFGSEMKKEPDYHLALLEGLRPPSTLKKLHIHDYRGLHFPSWMNFACIESSLPMIVSITLESCFECVGLPPFGLLPSLQSLHLISLKSLEYVHDDDHQVSDSSLINDQQLFPALKELHLVSLKNLKGFRRSRGEEVDPMSSSSSVPIAQQLLPALEFLSIEYTQLPDDNQFGCLGYLKTLVVIFPDNSEVFPEWIWNLSSLECLQLKSCYSLASLPDSMSRLSSLKQLQIEGCSRELEKRCSSTGEDWPKISGIQFTLDR